VYKGVEQSTANIQMIGNLYGLSNATPDKIDEVKFSIGLAPGAPPIDLTKMKIVFSTPNTGPIILTQGANASVAVFTTKLNGVGAVVNNMSANDQVEVHFMVAGVDPNTKMNLELRPSVGAALPFSKTAPATIAKTNILY
jgi:archaellin